jgi:hypothetical protein
MATSRIALVLVLALVAFPAGAGTGADAPVLVELFTSEGCSSCPPADALLARLAEDRAGEIRVVALSEHVDYWDDLGWRDPFSSPVFTQRQEAYARRFRLAGLYTPQLVIAGRSQALGSDGRAVRAAIAAAAREDSGRIEARVTAAGASELAVDVEATWNAGVAADVLIALVQDRATSRVARGENAGRTLEHVAVVRSLARVGTGVGAFAARANLPRPDKRDAARLVVFVQERDGGPVRAVTTVELP